MGAFDSEGYAYLGTEDNPRQVSLPFPFVDSGTQESQLFVDSARNALGEVVATKVGRSSKKVNMEWKFMWPEKLAEIYGFLDNHFYFMFTYFSIYLNDWNTIECYHGNLTGRPFMVNKETGKAKYIRDVSFNAIDTGR